MADYQFSEKSLAIGSAALDFNLKGVDGKMHSLASYKQPILVIAAVCNHCPYVQAYLDRMIDLQARYASRGVKMIGINSNDVSRYPDDSFEKMVEMAKERGFNFDYLHDDDQSVAEAYCFERTPQFFVFDEKRCLRYTGGFDDGCKDISLVTERPLEDAIIELLEGQTVTRSEAPSIGCSVKWVK